MHRCAPLLETLVPDAMAVAVAAVVLVAVLVLARGSVMCLRGDMRGLASSATQPPSLSTICTFKSNYEEQINCKLHVEC